MSDAQPNADVEEAVPLSATDVEYGYGDLTVLEGASISVPDGVTTALIGPNGSGKTTLLRILCGLATPRSGSVDRPEVETARAVGYLPQRPSFRADFTVGETISFYQRLVGVSDPDPAIPLGRVGLADEREHPVRGLSGGMTRLLGIAQATVGDPPVVVLDEPTSGLDPGTREAIHDTIVGLASEGTAVLFSSHDLDGVNRRADRVAILADGAVQAEVSPEDLREQTGTDSLREAYDRCVSADGWLLDSKGES